MTKSIGVPGCSLIGQKDGLSLIKDRVGGNYFWASLTGVSVDYPTYDMAVGAYLGESIVWRDDANNTSCGVNNTAKE